MDNLLSRQQILEGGKRNTGILYEMSLKAGNERRQGYHHEEWPAGNSGYLSDMRDQDVPYREELTRAFRVTRTKGGLGFSLSPLVIVSM